MNYQRLCEKRDQLQRLQSLIPSEVLEKFDRAFEIEYTHNSTAIEGNTLTLIQTKAILEDGLSIGGKTCLEEYLKIRNNVENKRSEQNMPSLKHAFDISVRVDTPVVVGQNEINGRRQLIPILSGELTGEGLHGTVLPGGVDSQVIRPNGVCELSARYGVQMDDGSSFYIQNDGIRTVPGEYVEAVKKGEFIDPKLYYFCTHPVFEVYDERLNWLNEKIFVCCATRLPDQVILGYYTVEAE